MGLADGNTVLPVEVQCHAGYRGEETPRQLRLGERAVAVVEVLDRWLSPDHRYFKILGDDRGVYILRHDETAGSWDLIFFKQK